MRRTGLHAGLLGIAIWTGVLAAPALDPGTRGLLPSPDAVAAAEPDLRVVSDARYDVQPDRRRVHVSVRAVATSMRADTTYTRYFYTSTTLTIPRAARTIRASDSGGRLKVRVVRRTADAALVQVTFGRRVYYKRDYPFTLSFDLVDAGGSPTRELRVGSALATFSTWAFASRDTGGSTVTVVFPKGYAARTSAPAFHRPTRTAAGTTVFRTGSLAYPLRFVAFFVGERTGAYRETSTTLTVAGRNLRVVIRAWRDDPAWGRSMLALVKVSLPALGRAIGSPVPGNGPLIVEETVGSAIDGLGAVFDPAAGRIQVANTASPHVTLQGLAHAWFGPDLAADRWVAEGFAAYYARAVGPSANVAFPPVGPGPGRLPRRMPLNAWELAGREDPAADAYARAAALHVATLVADRVGRPGLGAVWKAVASDSPTYPARDATAVATTSEGTGGTGQPPDWRVLLDVIAAETGEDVTDIWREWVARPSDESLLDARTAARRDYVEVIGLAGDWQLPPSIHAAMSAWQFDAAVTLLATARGALAGRASVERAASEAGLVAPGTLRNAFERDDGLATTVAEANAELVAIEQLVRASAVLGAPRDPIANLGLSDVDPGAILANAREAFAQGDLGRAVELAQDAVKLVDGAGERGRGRITQVAALGAAALALSLLLGLALVRRYRRRRTAAWFGR